MRWILDANSLIYLIKTNLEDLFYELIDGNVVIDTSVHEEVVDNGIKHNYPDAVQAKKFLEKNHVPIIPVDTSVEIDKFRDAGETSCYILARKEGTIISSDVRANRKFEKHGISSIHLDFFFYIWFLDQKIDENKLERILTSLEEIYATMPERKSHLLNLISKKRRLRDDQDN